MKPEVASRRIKSFGQRFGEAHLYLAYHAAFPLALTPDLLYHLWANFQQDIHGELLNIPWLAVADLLLSGLCDEVGYELYEMKTTVRDLLLRELKSNSRFGEKRINELSDFLLTYVREQIDSHDPDIRDFAQAQRWTALAYTQPNEAARELALTLKKLNLEEKAEWVRIASMLETFAEPLAGFAPLMTYARGMASLVCGNQAKAVNEFSQVTNKGENLEVAGVELLIPKLLPRKAVVLENPEGQVPLDSAYYVERPPMETDCYQTILQSGAFIRIKAPGQMGKSSLMSRILDHARKHDCQATSINFQSAGTEFLGDLDLFLQWLCAIISDNLNLPEKISDYWKGVLGSKTKCTNYFQRYLLVKIDRPLALGLDEVDAIFKHPQIVSDFFGLLRFWHERAKNESVWKKLRVVIVHSKEVYIPLNINQSPFNVGLPVGLPEFNQQQVQDLVQRHGLSWSNSQVQKLMMLVGGHPYLVRVALYEIARERITLNQLEQIALKEASPYSDHLRRHLLNLQTDVQLLEALKEVVIADEPVDVGTTAAFQLHSMGLVKFQGNKIMPSSDLYRRYFCDQLFANLQ
ncbi:hypothetical protein NIES2100_66480 [Calothrix sp. NIES-2100]|uniref:AAA-like domain-containing protein n=1 Tax=Calothrix sp. NIES-2100 TaxID=1954172 RepID=UPI000B61BFB9|nr:hypothetical protein NIES2100_66480 [Calothrix sp. NIES-2100]